MRQYFITNQDTANVVSSTTTTIKTDSQKPIALTSGRTELRSVSFPFSFYSINTNNQRFQILEGINAITILMTPGNYNSVDFCAMLKTLFEAGTMAAETYTVTISNSTGILTIATVATNIGIRMASYKKAARVLGFAATDVAAAATSISGSYPVQLLYSKIFLCSAEISRQLSSQLNQYPTDKIL